jgi:hypothetical protein
LHPFTDLPALASVHLSVSPKKRGHCSLGILGLKHLVYTPQTRGGSTMKARRHAAIFLRDFTLTVAVSLATAAVFTWLFPIQPIVIKEGNT